MTREQFKETRARLGWTQKETADHLGVTLRCVQMYEAGDRPISGPAAKLIGLLAGG